MTTLTLWSPVRAITNPAVFQLPEKPLNPPKPTEPLSFDPIVLETPQAWTEALYEVYKSGICGLDLETTGLDPLVNQVRLCQLSLPSGRVYVADLWKLPSSLADLAELVENPDTRIVGHNFKFDLSFIQASQGRRLKMTNLFDTMLASQVAWAGLFFLVPANKSNKNPWKNKSPGHSLRAVAERHLGVELNKEYQVSNWTGELSSEQIKYAGLDAKVLLPLYDILLELLQRNHLVHIAEMEFKALPSVVELELQGLPLNSPATRTMLEQIETQTQETIQALQIEAQKNGFVPRPKKGTKYSPLLNPRSTQDVLEYLRSQNLDVASTKLPLLRIPVQQIKAHK